MENLFVENELQTITNLINQYKADLVKLGAKDYGASMDLSDVPHKGKHIKHKITLLHKYANVRFFDSKRGY